MPNDQTIQEAVSGRNSLGRGGGRGNNLHAAEGGMFHQRRRNLSRPLLKVDEISHRRIKGND